MYTFSNNQKNKIKLTTHMWAVHQEKKIRRFQKQQLKMIHFKNNKKTVQIQNSCLKKIA